jgi:DNA-binding MurR/RpiR family transcriptional regulator
MKKLDVLSLIREKKRTLKGKKYLVGKYILDNYREAAFATVAELAEKAGVSRATVIRLAMDLGFEGYQQLQEAIQGTVQRDLTTIDRLKEYNQHLEEDGNPAIRVLLNDIQNLEDTLRGLHVKTIHKITKRIIEADRIVILAVGKVATLARLMELILSQSLGSVVNINTSSYLAYQELAKCGPNSLIIAFGFPRYPRETIELLKAAHQEGIPIVSITDSEMSPLVEYSEHVLIVKVKLVSHIDSYVALLSVIQAIATSVSLKRWDETVKRLKRIERLWKKNKVFY